MENMDKKNDGASGAKGVIDPNTVNGGAGVMDPNADPNAGATDAENYDSAFEMDAETFNRAIASGEIEVDAGDDYNTAADGQAGGQAGQGGRKPAAGRVIVIKHNGAEHVLDEGRAIELAQKGFDYDQKVGPHSRIARLLDQDPNAQAMMNDYFMRKFSGAPAPTQQPVRYDINNPNAVPVPAPAPTPTPTPTPVGKVDLTGFKPSKISDFNTEGEWLADNLTRAIELVESKRGSAPVHQPQPMQGQPTPGAGTGAPMSPAQAAMQVASVLHNYDPQHAQMVLPHIDNFAANLTVADYRRYTRSLPDFLEFYDMVKGEVLAGRVPNPAFTPAQGQSPQPTPTQIPRNPDMGSGKRSAVTPKPRRFVMKPGGGPIPPTNPGKKINIWDLSNEQFDKFVNSKMQ